MTKHLRFLIVLLMTLVWSAGGAQTTIDFSNGLPTGWSKKGTVQSQTYKKKSCIQLLSTTITSPEFKDAFSSMKISLTRSGNGTNFTISYQIGNAAAVQIKTYTSSQVTQGSWKDYIIDIPTAAQVANCKFIFTSAQASYYISSIEFTKAGPSKTPTKVAFPAEYSNKTFTFTEGKLEGFTAPKATETNNVAGTIKYSSDNESAVKVNASTGDLSFPGYGEATITATFTPTDAETYNVSTDSYKVKNEAKKSDNILTFSGELKSFDNVREYKNTLSEANVTLNGSDGKTYIFISNGGKKGSARFLLPTKTGKLQSPTFPSYINGYNVVITYGIGGTGYPSVTANGKKVTGTVNGDYNKGTGATLSLDVADGSAFTVTSGTNALAISKIEITPNAVDETETLTLYESATNTLVAKTGVNVTLKRSMVENEWNTICLPFNVTAEQAKTAFGEGVMIAQLNKNSSGNKLSFSSVDAIVASTPYLIKPTIAAPADGYKFEGVTIRPDGKGNVAPNFVNTNSYLAFVGIYNTVDVTNNVIEVLNNNYYAAFLGANNTIFKAKNDGGKMKGFRAYFAIPNNVAASALCVMVNGTTTSIKSINGAVVESNAPVYNLQGQRVDGNNLTPGIYIKAGKKFVVR